MTKTIFVDTYVVTIASYYNTQRNKTSNTIRRIGSNQIKNFVNSHYQG